MSGVERQFDPPTRSQAERKLRRGIGARTALIAITIVLHFAYRTEPTYAGQDLTYWCDRLPRTVQIPLPTGEVGVLQRVDPPSENVEIPHCFLDIRWNGENYFASLYFDDPGFLKVVCETLSNYIGRAISEIGSLDIPSTDMRQS